jgi:hypothetical protein
MLEKGLEFPARLADESVVAFSPVHSSHFSLRGQKLTFPFDVFTWIRAILVPSELLTRMSTPFEFLLFGKRDEAPDAEFRGHKADAGSPGQLRRLYCGHFSSPLPILNTSTKLA